jgi:hypothetical protein
MSGPTDTLRSTMSFSKTLVPCTNLHADARTSIAAHGNMYVVPLAGCNLKSPGNYPSKT